MRPHCIAGTQIDGLHIEAFGSVIECVIWTEVQQPVQPGFVADTAFIGCQVDNAGNRERRHVVTGNQVNTHRIVFAVFAFDHMTETFIGKHCTEA